MNPSLPPTLLASQQSTRRLPKISRKLRRMRAAFDIVSDAVVAFVAPSLRLVLANEAACENLAYRRRELLALSLADVAPEATDGCLAEAIERLEQGTASRVHLVTAFRTRHGGEYFADATVQRVQDGGRPTFVMSARRLCSAPSPENRETLAPASRDALTELATRSGFEECLKLALERAQRDHWTFAVLFVDVDDFKKVNDTWGHLVGDDVLCSVARHLVSNIRPTDLAARYGGDEFVVFVGGVRSHREITHVAQRICQKISVPVGKNDPSPCTREITVSISIGITLCTNPCDSARDLICRADRAMYKAKALGRDGRWVLSVPAAAD